ncbi:NUDIX domain-containing protein [Solirubrobacter sp. CPCC 204708]|uniref:NUDIX domain-containing protein n=1 Tax=Solirubrobacter deserti TaxID=2282478 RepID=A0ABT4RBK5_9ACTN|nr:NUDIX domain-containing protein [Solirubrobacter deserti]MBE2317192.1 NUDIX domain-containing protein [Solirubrobacter deserti]MDA0135915.1 NUDIX domain-containing protein [Solirubrobacter deserti]
MTSTETRVGVGVVVRRPDGHVLVGRRLAEQGRPLAIPGGKLDPGETVEACARRELAEETGIIAGAARTYAAVLDHGWLVAGVLVDVTDPEPRVLEPDKFGEFRWIDPLSPPEPLFPLTAGLLSALT